MRLRDEARRVRQAPTDDQRLPQALHLRFMLSLPKISRVFPLQPY